MSVPGLVDASKVYVKADEYGGWGAFARVPIYAGDLVEKGVARVQNELDGNECPYVFTWSTSEPRKWATGSGASIFYNMSADPNTEMERDFKNNTWEIYAVRDIAKDEELTHVYISATWRKCFADLKPLAEEYLANKNKRNDAQPNKPKSSMFASMFSCCTNRDKEFADYVPETIEGGYPGVMDMSKVFVKKDSYGGAGAFALVDIKEGEFIEKGIVRLLPLDGNINPFVFTWSEGEPRKWATGSGASIFYNMCEDPNTHMVRDFKKNSWEIFATRDIKKGEELTHVYISATWRKCFEDLKPMAERYEAKQKQTNGSQ